MPKRARNNSKSATGWGLLWYDADRNGQLQAEAYPTYEKALSAKCGNKHIKVVKVNVRIALNVGRK